MAADDGTSQRFGYDAAGNITELGASARAYDVGNRLLQNGQVRYLYDAAGRLLQRLTSAGDGTVTAWSYQWNAQGLLESVERPDGGQVAFAYDPFGRRMLKAARLGDGGETRTRFVWDGDLLANEIVRHDGAEVFTRTYFHADEPFVPLAHADERPGVDALAWRFYLNDTIGAPDKIVDGAGELVHDLQRRVWGRVLREGDATPLRLPGQYEDVETGLHYNRFRYYDPEDVRFISPDPIGLQGDANLFAYVPNPLSWLDPVGWDWNYRLVGPDGTPYYNGRASDTETAGDIMSRHRNHPKPPNQRMDANDRLQQVTPVNEDRATVRGVEDAGSKETMKKGTNCKKDKKRNRIRGISDRKKDKDNDRGGVNYGDMRKQGAAAVAARSNDGTVAGMPSLGQHRPPPIPKGQPPNPLMATI
ncbi:MAG: RHS repeat-associated core domain-containing protein [Polyangiaceae bacterium]